MAYILPIAPYEVREFYERGGKQYVHVHGIQEEGFKFQYHEEIEPDAATGLTARWVPSMDTPYDDYGVSRPISNTWTRKLYNNGLYVPVQGELIIGGETNHPDMVHFTAMLGDHIAMPQANGFIVNQLGFDKMPLYVMDSTGKYIRRPDIVYLPDGITVDAEKSYNTKAAPSHTYPTHKQPRKNDEPTTV